MKFPISKVAVAAMSLAVAGEAHGQVIEARVSDALQSKQIDCTKIEDASERLKCYDSRDQNSQKKFGSISGRIFVQPITERSTRLPTKVYLIPLPLTDEAKGRFGQNPPSIPIYGLIQGVKQGTAAPNGNFRISHISEGRYLLVVASDAFSMRKSGEGCERLSEGTLVPESGSSFLTRCSMIEVHGGEETSIFLTLRARR